MPALAVVVTLAHFDAGTGQALRRAMAPDAAVVAVPYGSADRALVRESCAALNIAVVDAPAATTFGAAANAGAAATSSAALVFIDGAEPMSPGWHKALLAALAASGDGVAGPHVQLNAAPGEECGAIVTAVPLTLFGFELAILTGIQTRICVDAVARDCLMTARTTFEELGGFAEDFGSELEALDYCLRVAESGRRVMFEPATSFARRPVPAATDPLRRQRERAFAERWRERVEPHDNLWPELTNTLLHRTFFEDGVLVERIPIPAYRVIVHGDVAPPADFADRIFGARMKPTAVLWAAPGDVPPGATPCADAVEAARALTEVRGTDGIAFVRSDTMLARDWLNELIDALERAPDTVAATVVAQPADRAMPAAADARCTLVAPRHIPQHLRIGGGATCDVAVAEWLGCAVAAGRNIARVQRTSTAGGPAAVAIPAAEPVRETLPAPFASIIMLSWNAPEFTEKAIASIRARTSVPYEIIIVDNGSRPETVERLKAIAGIRVIYNAVNTGFAFACNQGLAAARGTHLVLLNNDVVVAHGWLEALIDVQRKNPTIGCSAPRTNRISGTQQLDVPYGDDLAAMPAFAAERAREQRGRWTRKFRVIGFCMCLDRRVVAEIGGLDPCFGTGNFEDDDYSLRIRAAGYDIAVCEDAFIHHYGSVSFRENSVDYNAVFRHNQALFGRRWNATFKGNTYQAHHLFRRGYIRERDFVPLPSPEAIGFDWVRPA